MPKRDVTFTPDTYYHIYNRGARLQNLFLETTNYEYILRQLRRCTELLDLNLIAYCLLPNHYHRLVHQNGNTPAGELPKRVFGGYSRAVKKRYGWHGTLFETRFKVRPVTDEGYLRHLCRYIHANPVKHGIRQDPGDWQWSDYLDWIRFRERDQVNRALISALFGPPEAYVAYVQMYLESFADIDQLSYLLDWEQEC